MEIICPMPDLDENGDLVAWPTLGPQVVDFIESNLVYGPGSLKGKPYVVRNEFKYFIYRAYEHYPEGHVEKHGSKEYNMSGRRRFRRVILSLPKGSAKCLSPDTILSLETGEEVRADEVKPGQSVQSYLDGGVVYRPVAAVEPQPAVENYLVKTTNGREITISEGHPFLVSGDWKKVESLRVGDDLTSVSGEVVGHDKVLSVDAVGERETIGIEVAGTHVHVTNGLVTHNTELMAILAICELHPDAPIRFNGYDPEAFGGLAPGRSILSPSIPMLAPNLDQVEKLAYGAVREIVALMDDSSMFDSNKERVMVNGESDSMIFPVAANAGALDGGRNTFNCIDESHRLIEDRHIQAFDTMTNNLPKRLADDPWQLTTTTAGDPSQPSVALEEYRMGLEIYEGKVNEPDTFFYHRQTSDENAKFETMEQRLIALEEASGPEAAEFRDLLSVAKDWDKPEKDHTYLERVWCNRWVQSTYSAFDSEKFVALGDPSQKIAPGSRIVLGFDGARNDDSTALIATDIDTGIQNVFGVWERPENVKKWTVPSGEVHAEIHAAMESYDVVYLYCDPPYWQQDIAEWTHTYGNIVVEWPTRNLNNMYYAIRSYSEAITLGEVGHDGNKVLEEHIKNSGKNESNQVDDEGLNKFRLAKRERDGKIDGAVAAVLSWQARLDAIADSEEEEYTDEQSFIPRRVR